ncbi:MAG: glycosyltransferase family 39 protein [Bacteroidetes bacterium]|nr:glycosyltransferase family 39 protein [Bacteroidota bacterium]
MARNTGRENTLGIHAPASCFPKIIILLICIFALLKKSTIKHVASFKIPLWIFAVITALYFSSGRVDLMDVDASQYAEISREMTHSPNWLQVYDHGHDYLDKPPMLFWTSALSMKLLGPTPFAYRLPSILMALLAVFATYRLTRLLYNENTARLAALVLASCQGFFLWTNDVRTDMMLAGFVATALWCIRECETRRRWYFVLGGTAAIACGMMTKGPIALFVPLFAFGSDWLLRRKWNLLFSPWHLLDLLLIGLFLMPMCIGLYQQFDLHPEKWVNGEQGVSGLKFFFWTQSFGRITGSNTWDNGANPLFLLNSMSWAFLPWILLFLTALFLNIRTMLLQKLHLNPGQEWLSTGGFILSYLALSSSHYQLPHYILVTFPLAAIIVAKLLSDFLNTDQYPRLCRTFAGIQTGISVLLLLGALLIISFVFPTSWWVIAFWLTGLAAWLFVNRRNHQGRRIIWTSVTSIIVANVFVTHFFYFPLLHFQVGTVVGRYIRSENIPADKIYAWRMQDPLDALDFYAQRRIPEIDSFPIPGQANDYLLMMQENLPSLDSAGLGYHVVKAGRMFKVSELTGEFLNPKTRREATKPWVLVLRK